MNVLLVCAAGMSTSILMKKLEKYAEEQGIQFSIRATGFNNAATDCVGVDCVLLGPQISYRKEAVQKAVGAIPVGVIAPADYGIGNCAHIFDQISSLISNNE